MINLVVVTVVTLVVVVRQRDDCSDSAMLLLLHGSWRCCWRFDCLHLVYGTIWIVLLLGEEHALDVLSSGAVVVGVMLCLSKRDLRIVSLLFWFEVAAAWHCCTNYYYSMNGDGPGQLADHVVPSFTLVTK